MSRYTMVTNAISLCLPPLLNRFGWRTYPRRTYVTQETQEAAFESEEPGSSKGVKAVGFRSSSLEGSRQTEEKDVRSDKHVLKCTSESG